MPINHFLRVQPVHVGVIFYGAVGARVLGRRQCGWCEGELVPVLVCTKCKLWLMRVGSMCVACEGVGRWDSRGGSLGVCGDGGCQLASVCACVKSFFRLCLPALSPCCV